MIAKFFLEKFGGEVTITSRPEATIENSQGTVVTFRVPVSTS